MTDAHLLILSWLLYWNATRMWQVTEIKMVISHGIKYIYGANVTRCLKESFT